MASASTLYLVHLEIDGAIDASVAADSVQLAPGLHLVESTATRSQLYHRIKRRHAPDRLLVAPLTEPPKFMGMAPGALRWLRARSDRRAR
ncbi:hypothetical protein ACF3M1_02710 [Luteimonas sp. WGS1318]|uniref:hypothetical protein n=1 Tax=Luteimonas sp. WGS1318 TaxID=3366815 RepID=UPI00372CF1D4